MKKFLVMLLAIIAVMCSFAACGENNGGGDKTTPDTNVEQPADNSGTSGNGGGNQGGEQTPSTNVVQPITNGGGYEFN